MGSTRKRFSALILFIASNVLAQAPVSVDGIISAYAQALGGLPAIDAISSRKITAGAKLLGKVELFWQQPNKVLLLSGKQRTGFDGSRGWEYSKRKRERRLPQGGQMLLENDGNPLRYAHLRQLYPEVIGRPSQTIDGVLMNVLAAPNDLAETVFYFDARTHLLARIDEKGDTSAYYTQTVWFEDYKAVEGVLFPFHITQKTTAPGGSSEDFKVKSVEYNVPLDPEIFAKPQSSKIIFGGKR